VSRKRLGGAGGIVRGAALPGAAGPPLGPARPPAPAAPPDQTATPKPAAAPAPTPANTGTPSGRPRATPTPRPTARPGPHPTDPWDVIRAYYRDVETHQYAKAWALIRSALGTGQTYQQFVAGYTCTGTEQPAKLGQSGHQVSFNLAVVNRCTGAAQYYKGTDTVLGGKIVAAHVTRTS